MIKLLIKLFVKDRENVTDLKTRESYGIFAGCLGIVCNILLASAKLVVGIVSNSISVTADAVNNFSDCASSLVTVISFKLAALPPDDEHPFGHGRFEYIASLIVSFLVLFMGFELTRSSVDKILNPEPVAFHIISLVILIASVLVKLWMSLSYKFIGKKIDSQTMRATATDSRNDSLATLATVGVMVFSIFSDIPIDGYVGLLVAVFIIFSGITLLRETVSPLLGEAPDPETVKSIEKKVLSYDGIVGIHDLVFHNYGPGRSFVSLHAEVPANRNILESHDTIDRIERDVANEMQLEIVIHMDPLIVDDERVNQLRGETLALVKKIDERLSIHDFRVVDGPTHTNLIFDVLVPHKFDRSAVALTDEINVKIKELNPNYFAVINVDTSYVNI